MSDKHISWNPWKNKREIARAYQEQQDLLFQQQQREADRRQKEQQYKDQLRRQQEQHQEEIRRREQELARERLNLAHEREVRAQREYEAREMEQQEQERLAWEAQETQRKERERRQREQRKRSERLKRLKMNTPDSLRSLRELIRTRYELDMEIWRLRDVRAPDRPIVEEKMAKSDAVLAEIVAIVSSWEGTEESWNVNEWEMAQDVRNRLLIGGKRRWDSPPWGED